MSSNEPALEDPSNTETEESTAARQKKRPRRVSFAEITSVHVFDRDEDSEAPSSDPNDDNAKNDEWEQFNRDIGFLHGDHNEQERGEYEGEGDDGESFLRPMESPASNAGSMTSNDEDNFFGPVSASFIRPGRLSDSGASDVHDITMDSTAFSQHFRSLAKSDSGGDLKTPTGVLLSFEENTPSQNTIPGSNLGSSMLMNSAKKPMSAASTSVEKLSDGSDSNDMSLVESKPNRYDYGRLSFGWEEALLAEGVKDLHTDNSISSPIRDPTSTSTDKLNHSSDLLNKGMLSTKEPEASEMSPKVVSHVLNCGTAANQENGIPQLDEMLTKKPDASEMSPKPDAHVNSGTRANQESGISRVDLLSQQPSFSGSPLTKSKRSQTVFQGSRASNSLLISTPQNHILSVTDGIGRRSETVSSVQKSISKLRILDASPFASNLNVKMNSLLMPSESLYRTPPCNTSLHRNIEDAEIKHVDALAARRDQSDYSTGPASILKFGTSPAPRSTEVLVREQSSGLVRVRSLVSQLTWSGNKTNMNILTSEDLTGKIVVTPRRDSVFTKIALDHENIMKAAGMPGKSVHSIEESLIKKSVLNSLPVSKRIREGLMSGESECVEEIRKPERSTKIQKTVGPEFEVLSRHHNGSNIDMISGASECVEEICRPESSPKVQKSVEPEFEFLSGNKNGSNIETSTVGDESRLRHWNDVLSEFLAKKVLPPSTDKLNLQSIGVLEDRLVKLQRLQTYEMHHNIIQSQKSVEDLANIQSKRAAEAKMLLHRLVHESAKLQLLGVKEEKLQRNVDSLRRGIQEAQFLKLNSLPQINAACIRDANINGSHCPLINIRCREEEVPGYKVIGLRQLHDSFESKLTSLTKSLHSSCKLKGVLRHDETVSAVNGYLKKKECCKYLRSDLQLWKVHNISTTNGNRNLVLNYVDFVIQRMTFKAGSSSSLNISNESNDDNISKRFPNMDAWTALSFTLNTIATQKYVGSRSLVQETQITSSVLGNLVDVAEEVQQARFELQNLTHARFVSPSVGQLDLYFHFSGLKSGRKVELTLDMSCLKWGIYPSDIMPYKLEDSSVLSRETLHGHLSAEIRAAIQSLDFGFFRILRICRTVSQVVQAWSR